MSADVAIFDRLAAIMAEARPRLGAAGFADKRRVIGLLSDKAPDSKREIRAIGVAIDEGVPTVLARTERPMLGVEMDRLVKALEDDTGIKAELARQVVRSFAFALDLGPPPSIYEAGAAAAMPPVPQPAAGGDAWAGLSAAVAPPAQSAPPAPTHQTMPPQQAPGTYPGGAYPGPAPVQPQYGAGPYQPPGYHGGQMPPVSPYQAPKSKMTAGRIALFVVGGVVVLGGLAKLGESGSRPGGRTTTASALTEWTCPRIAEHSVQMSQQQPIRLRSITNVRETGRTATLANCLGFASTENGDTGDVYMRAYVEGTNIMVAYQGEPFSN